MSSSAEEEQQPGTARPSLALADDQLNAADTTLTPEHEEPEVIDMKAHNEPIAIVNSSSSSAAARQYHHGDLHFRGHTARSQSIASASSFSQTNLEEIPLAGDGIEDDDDEERRGFNDIANAMRQPSISLGSGAVSSPEVSVGVGGGWKSSLSSMISKTSPFSSPATSPQAPSTSKISSFASMLAMTGATADPVLKKIETTKDDRRRSIETGGLNKLQEDFDRLKDKVEAQAQAAASGGSTSSGSKRDSARVREAEQFGDELHPVPEEATPDTTIDESVAAAPATGIISDSPVDWEFWGAVVNDYEEVARTRSKQLSRAIQRGIPPVIRGTIWQLMSSSKSLDLETVYQALLRQPSFHEKAIHKDIQRTFPNNSYFKKGGMGEGNLFNVLKAYSLYDPDVGYTQGLGFIVAAFLLNMPDEEAFCVLVRLMQSYDLRSQFLPEMPGLQLRLFQFDRLLEDLLPVLHRHFVRIGIKSSVFAQWFLTLFAYRFPLSLVYRIFDIILAEGTEAIFRFAVAIMAKNEEHFLSLSFEGALQFLQDGVFDVYKQNPDGSADDPEEEQWDSDRFVDDAYAQKITPFMLDTFAMEWQEQCRVTNATAVELDTLRTANRTLTKEVQRLQSTVSGMNSEHVDLINQLVAIRVEKEEVENELVRYKMLYAELAHSQQESMSTHRLSQK